MNVNLYVIEDYRKKDDFVVRINKPNSKPIQKEGKIDAKCVLTKDYENKSAFRPQNNKPNSKPIFKRMNVNFCTKGYYKSKLKALKKPPLLEVNSESLRKDW
jgi:hypothetical protein